MSELPNVSFFSLAAICHLYNAFVRCYPTDEIAALMKWNYDGDGADLVYFFIFHLLAEMQLCCRAALTKLADLERRVLIQNVQSLWCIVLEESDPPAHHARNTFWRIIGDPFREHFSGERSAANTVRGAAESTVRWLLCTLAAPAFLEVSRHKGYIGIRALYSSGDISNTGGILTWEPFLSERFLSAELYH